MRKGRRERIEKGSREGIEKETRRQFEEKEGLRDTSRSETAMLPLFLQVLRVELKHQNLVFTGL